MTTPVRAATRPPASGRALSAGLRALVAGRTGWLAPVGRLIGVPARMRYADFLPEAQALAERDPAPLARALGLVLCLAFAGTLLWAALSEVEQVATAPAVVRPAGKVKIVNHPEGGKVAAVHVKDGDRVREGQPLVSLDSEAVREEVVKRTAEWQGLAAEAARLEAEAVETPSVFPPDLIQARPDLVRAQTALFQSRIEALAVRRAAADQVIRQRESELAALQVRIGQMSDGLAILEEQEKAIAGLAGKGYFPKLRYLSVKRQVSELVGQIAETRKNAAASAAALAEARDRRRAVDEEWRAQVLDRLSAVGREAERARSLMLQEETRLRNRIVRAPSDGVIQGLAVTAPGQSVAPNETLLHIVPDDDRLVIEAMVANDDIGHIRIGQKATIKVRAYDYVRYGTLAGTVERVGADAVEDRRTGALAFPVTVRAERAWLGEGAERRPLTAGMEVEVDLLIGTRTVLSYLTDRLTRTRDAAFRER